MNIIICCKPDEHHLYKAKVNDLKHKIIFSDCEQLDEQMPIVVTLPNIEFYGHVSPKRLPEIFHDGADDLKIQTARLYDVDMEKFLSESQYRKLVISFEHIIEDVDTWTTETLQQLLDEFVARQTQQKHVVLEALKMALIKTTKGPTVLSILEAFGQKQTLQNIHQYLHKYKNKI